MFDYLSMFAVLEVVSSEIVVGTISDGMLLCLGSGLNLFLCTPSFGLGLSQSCKRSTGCDVRSSISAFKVIQRITTCLRR